MKEVQVEAKRRKVELLILAYGTSHRVAEAEPSRHQRHPARNLLSASLQSTDLNSLTNAIGGLKRG